MGELWGLLCLSLEKTWQPPGHFSWSDLIFIWGSSSTNSRFMKRQFQRGEQERPTGGENACFSVSLWKGELLTYLILPLEGPPHIPKALECLWSIFQALLLISDGAHFAAGRLLPPALPFPVPSIGPGTCRLGKCWLNRCVREWMDELECSFANNANSEPRSLWPLASQLTSLALRLLIWKEK